MASYEVLDLVLKQLEQISSKQDELSSYIHAIDIKVENLRTRYGFVGAVCGIASSVVTVVFMVIFK